MTPQAKQRRTKMVYINKIDRLRKVRQLPASGLAGCIDGVSVAHLRNMLWHIKQFGF